MSNVILLKAGSTNVRRLLPNSTHAPSHNYSVGCCADVPFFFKKNRALFSPSAYVLGESRRSDHHTTLQGYSS